MGVHEQIRPVAMQDARPAAFQGSRVFFVEPAARRFDQSAPNLSNGGKVTKYLPYTKLSVGIGIIT
jgi:hypothetical protein